MILNLFYQIWISITTKIIGFFPNGSIPQVVKDFADTITPYFQYASVYFPVSFAIELLLVATTIHAILLGFKMYLWIYAMIKGDG